MDLDGSGVLYTSATWLLSKHFPYRAHVRYINPVNSVVRYEAGTDLWKAMESAVSIMSHEVISNGATHVASFELELDLWERRVIARGVCAKVGE